ncbi:MAG TPA: hypothetical protein VNS79_05475 [Sphingobium sp.]|nr:hypothetical protein [Sphingobium sp.]
MPHPDLRRRMPALRTMALCALPCLLLAGCGGGGSNEAAGNAVEMRDMDVVDGTVNDSMTDLDAVRANGIGTPGNASNVSRPAAPRGTSDEDSPDAETVAAE